MSFRLGYFLVQQGLLREQQVDRAMRRQWVLGGSLGTNLLELGLLGVEELEEALQQVFTLDEEVPFSSPGATALASVPLEFVRQFQLVPLGRVGGILYVWSADDGPPVASLPLGYWLGLELKAVTVPQLRLFQAMRDFYGIACPPRLRALDQRHTKAFVLPPNWEPGSTSAPLQVQPQAQPAIEAPLPTKPAPRETQSAQTQSPATPAQKPQEKSKASQEDSKEQKARKREIRKDSLWSSPEDLPSSTDGKLPESKPKAPTASKAHTDTPERQEKPPQTKPDTAQASAPPEAQETRTAGSSVEKASKEEPKKAEEARPAHETKSAKKSQETDLSATKAADQDEPSSKEEASQPATPAPEAKEAREASVSEEEAKQAPPAADTDQAQAETPSKTPTKTKPKEAKKAKASEKPDKTASKASEKPDKTASKASDQEAKDPDKAEKDTPARLRAQKKEQEEETPPTPTQEAQEDESAEGAELVDESQGTEERPTLTPETALTAEQKRKLSLPPVSKLRNAFRRPAALKQATDEETKPSPNKKPDKSETKNDDKKKPAKKKPATIPDATPTTAQAEEKKTPTLPDSKTAQISSSRVERGRNRRSEPTLTDGFFRNQMKTLHDAGQESEEETLHPDDEIIELSNETNEHAPVVMPESETNEHDQVTPDLLITQAEGNRPTLDVGSPVGARFSEQLTASTPPLQNPNKATQRMPVQGGGLSLQPDLQNSLTVPGMPAFSDAEAVQILSVKQDGSRAPQATLPTHMFHNNEAAADASIEIDLDFDTDPPQVSRSGSYQSVQPFSATMEEYLSTNSPPQRQTLCDQLLSYGSSLVPEMLKHIPFQEGWDGTLEDTELLRRLVHLCEQVGDPALYRLLQLSQKEDRGLRFRALTLLGGWLSPRAIPPLVQTLLSEQDPQTRRVLRKILLGYRQRVEFSKLLQFLRKNLKSNDLDRLQKAILLLEDLRIVEAIPDLIALLHHKVASVREVVLTALKHLCLQDFGTSSALWKEWYEEHHITSRRRWMVDAMGHPLEEIRLFIQEDLAEEFGDDFGYTAESSESDREAVQKLASLWISNES